MVLTVDGHQIRIELFILNEIISPELKELLQNVVL